MNPIISLVFDVLIFISLAVTIYYCVSLSRQFNEVQESKRAFQDLIKAMNFASARAEGAILELKQSMNEEGSQIQEQINKARGIEAELEIIIQAGDSLADRLEKASTNKAAQIVNIDKFVEEDEAAAAAEDSIASFLEENDDDDDAFKTKAELELLEAVRRRQK